MFYDNLKAICDKKNLKITPLIIECGGTKGGLSGWRNGASPNSDIVIKLAQRLNVSCDYLLTGNNSISNVDISSQETELSDDEQELLTEYKKLDFRGRSAVMSVIVAEQERMTSEKNTNRDTKIG